MGDVRPCVLIVDDDDAVREVVSAALGDAGFTTHDTADGSDILALVPTIDPDLIVLEVMLPNLDGFGLLASLRARTDVPVIVLTSRSEEVDRVVGLGLGADDYVVKPFSASELTARVGSVLRRSASHRRGGSESLRFRDLGIHVRSREVTVRNEMVSLTAIEFDLLAFLASSPNQVFSRGQLLRHVWDSSADQQDPSTVTVHVQRLRSKIEVDPKRPRFIATVRGVGYRFVA